MNPSGKRGLFIVVEGLDRSGKTSQCQMLVEQMIRSGRQAKYGKFPDRATPTGKMINSYLTSQTQQDDHSIHLLFSANRWEAVKSMLEDIEAGITLVIDRYSFSGVVYSTAKDNPDLTLEWAWSPEMGLPKPDVVLFFALSPEQQALRGGFGDERYETNKMQMRVRELYKDVFERVPGLELRTIDASSTLYNVSKTTWEVLQTEFEKQRGPLGRLEALATST